MRHLGATLLIILAAHGSSVRGQTPDAAPLPLLAVPFISQSEALCGGAAAAMLLRFWGEKDVAAESFAHLVDRSAAGIRTDALIGELRRRGWDATGIAGTRALLARELAQGRPVVTLIEDRPGTYHYVVIVARHDRGIVFHDPARVPFRVMTVIEFERRWNAADRWMAVVVPPAAAADRPLDAPAAAPLSSCDQLISDGVAAARNDDLGVAERTLTSALSCPGSAAARELAGVRLIQQRWNDVESLASAAVGQDSGDTYAWKLLATARFIQDDALGALDAWNHAAEPRLDVVRIDGLRRTRHRVVERLLDVGTGETLTAAALVRAQRRMRELPAAVSTRLEYRPVPSGLAELRGAVVERSILPTSPLSLAALGVSAAVSREVRAALGSVTGGGEEIVLGWRFWEHRRRIAAGIRAPAPWGGVWGAEGFQERQSFTSAAFPDARRAGAELTQSNWATPWLRWSLAAGVDRWRGVGTFGSVSGSVRLASARDRLTVQAQTSAWLGQNGFTAGGAAVRARSAIEPRGMVWLATAATETASTRTPMDLWPAGDTGLARTTLLRAHPLLAGGGRMRISRIGRVVHNASLEGQRWWRIMGPIRGAAAAFVDAARTSRSPAGTRRHDVDAGIGARFIGVGVPGILRVDLATGFNDRARALSFVYAVE